MLDRRTQRFLEKNLKGLLQDTLEWMESRNAALREESPLGDTTPAEAKLFASLRGRERSISELARVLSVSRQAVHQTVHRLVERGVVELVETRADARTKRVRITPQGQRVQTLAARNLRQVEREIARKIGRENLEQVRTLLVSLLDSVAPTERGRERD